MYDTSSQDALTLEDSSWERILERLGTNLQVWLRPTRAESTADSETEPHRSFSLSNTRTRKVLYPQSPTHAGRTSRQPQRPLLSKPRTTALVQAGVVSHLTRHNCCLVTLGTQRQGDPLSGHWGKGTQSTSFVMI